MHCSARKQRQGLTLVEVVAGLVLMATVLVGSMLALAAHRRQHRYANDKLVAVAIADELLHQFDRSGDGIPAAASGVVATRPEWSWRTRVQGTTNPAGVLMRVVRLEVVHNVRGTVCARVDLVQPLAVGSSP